MKGLGLTLAPLNMLPVLRDIDTEEDLKEWVKSREVGSGKGGMAVGGILWSCCLL